MHSEEMTSHDRLVAALTGRPVDRVPWSPFLAYWWEHQPQGLQDGGQIRFLREIGADALLRGFLTPFTHTDVTGLLLAQSDSMPGCETQVSEQGRDVRTTVTTPVGELTLLTRSSTEGNTRFVIEHPIKRREDYKTLAYLVEHMVIRPDYAPVAAQIAEVGDGGLCVPLISPFGKTPFQSLVEHFIGTERLVYDLMDYPEEVEGLLALMSARAEEAVNIAIESPAEAFITWEDSSTTNVSPALFRRYIYPDMRRWAELVHGAGKLLLHHACGHVRALLSIMAEEGVDAVESLSPPPTGNVEVWEAQAVLGRETGIVGGIEPVHFLQLDLPALRLYVNDLLDRTNPHHYVLANSDSCPPGVTVDKFRLVTQIVHERCG
jgi:uroporphyrinogen-III decarboxylase